MADVLKKFGKYFLLDLLAQGGMAEIYRARMEVPNGGARLVAIKRVLPTFSRNPEFVKMFKAEINTTCNLNHPNIVQIYDFGVEQGLLFLSMEHIDGKNLRQLITRVQESKVKLPVDICSFIIMQSASAMAYAHAFRDKISGKNLNIVHRDISPQNVLISYDGTVKIIDFGIAKAISNTESTRAGIIKGKPSYLSPEQISGEELDGRSDVFALGTVFWEILVGRKLFSGENDFAVIKMIENCTAHVQPPSHFNSEVPPELDAIVLKRLQKDRTLRYNTADELQKALQRFLNQAHIDFTLQDLAAFAREQFKNEIIEDRKHLMRLNEKIESLLMVEKEESHEIERYEQTATVPMGSSQKAGVKHSPTRATGLTKGSRTGIKELEIDKKDKTVIKLEPHTQAQGASKNDMTSHTQSYSAYSKSIEVARPAMAKSVQVKSGGGMSYVAAGFIAVALGAGYMFKDDVGKFFATSESAKKIEVGTLTIDGNVSDATVKINEKVVAHSLPATIRDVPANQEMMVYVDSNGFLKSSQQLALKTGESKSLYFELVREEDRSLASSQKLVPLKLMISPASFGSKTTMQINGQSVDPLSAIGSAPLNKEFEVAIQREGFRDFKNTYRLNDADLAGKSDAVLDITLIPERSGLITIRTSPSTTDAYLIKDGKQLVLTYPFNKIKVPTGTYELHLENRHVGLQRVETIEVLDGRPQIIEGQLRSGNKRTPSSRR